MSVFEDHLPCPGLDRWLPQLLGDEDVRWWSAPAQRGWRAPGALRRLLADWPPLSSNETAPETAKPGRIRVLVVITPLSEDAGRLGALAVPLRETLGPGGLLVDLAVPVRRGPAAWVRPWVYRRRLREAAAQRLRGWLDLGCFAPEQWIALEPPNTVVTLARVRVRPCGRG